MFFPNETITKFIVHSVVAPLILSVAYIYIAFNIFLESNIFEVFNLYYGLEDLYTVFSNESFLLIFWLISYQLVCLLVHGYLVIVSDIMFRALLWFSF